MDGFHATLVDTGGLVRPIGARAVIGSDADACDVTVLHATVSSVHAYVGCAGGVWYAEDADSRNGTRVDGVPVTTPRPIADGARIELGAVTLTFHPAPAAPP